MKHLNGRFLTPGYKLKIIIFAERESKLKFGLFNDFFIFCKTSFFFPKSPSMAKSESSRLNFFYGIMQSKDFICRTKIAEGLSFGLSKKNLSKRFFESLGNKRQLFIHDRVFLFFLIKTDEQENQTQLNNFSN